MKTLSVILLSGALTWNVTGQAAAPAVTPLTAYAGTLGSPCRVAAAPSGDLYVSDPGGRQVVVFGAAGQQLAAHTGLGKPLGIAIDGQGRIFLADQETGSVSVFDAQWTLLYKLGAGDGEFQLPNHIALGAELAGAAVYVSDSAANVVKVYDGPAFIRQVGNAGTGPGQFDFPAGLCVNPAGDLFVVDQNNDRVQVFDSSGNFLRSFNLGSSIPAGRSQAALLDNVLRLYVADTFQGTVKVFDSASGVALTNIGIFGGALGQLSAPCGLALDRFNRLCVASANNGRLELYGLDSFLHVSTSLPSGPIAAGTDLVLTARAGGEGPLAFEWQRNGQPLAGETNASLAIRNLGTAEAGSYSVIVTSASGSLTCSVASFVVLTPPAILREPENRAVLRGTEVVHSVQASGTDLAYQWFHNGLELGGATDDSLRLPAVQPHEAGDYSVRVSNPLGSVLSTTAFLSVLTPPSQMEIVSTVTLLDRSFGLTINVDPGYDYTLEASTNFTHWQPLTRFANDAGLVEFVDIEAPNFHTRFYRVQWTP